MRKVEFITGTHTIRAHLVLLVAVVLLPLLGLAAFLGVDYAKARRELIEHQRLDVINNLTFVLDREIEGTKALLRSLAASPDLQAGNLDRFWRHANGAVRTRNLDAIVLTDPAGQRVLSTLVPFGQPLPKRTDMKPFEGVFAGREAVSDLTTGKTSLRQIFLVSVPVRVGDTVAYALSAGTLVERLNAVFAEAGLKPQWGAAIVDRQGRLLAHTSSSDRLTGRLVGPEALRVVLDGEEAGQFDHVNQQGIPVSCNFRRSSVSGWTFVVGVPKQILNAPLHWTFTLLGASGAAAVLFAVGLASLLARRISAPVHGLRCSALALTDGKPSTIPRSKISELEEVGKAFDYAARIAAERRKLQEQLIVSQERLTQAVGVAALGIFDHYHITDELEFSSALRQMFGFNEYEPIGMSSWIERIFMEDRAALRERVARAHDPAGDGIYACEYQVVHPTLGTRWLDARSQTFFEGNGAARRPFRTIGAVRDITERKRAEEHLHFVMQELSHRSKNLLAVIQAMAAQTARSAGSLDEFQIKFSGRLRGLAASHDLLASQNWAGAPLRLLLRRQLELFGEIGGSHQQNEGPEVVVAPAAAQAIGLALHELATNSIKHGALSWPAGKVIVAWACETDGAGALLVRLNWREFGGPPVRPPARKGFGHSVIEDMAAHSLGGNVAIDFAVAGLSWTLAFSGQHIVNEPVKGEGRYVLTNSSAAGCGRHDDEVEDLHTLASD